MSDQIETVDVVVRCRNEMPHAERCFEGLARQRGVIPRALVLECGSTDGSREAAVAAGLRIVDIDPKRYIPGRVLNEGMRLTESGLVAFINADAVPLDEHALARLIEPLRAGAAASYARQVARADAHRLTKVDYARAFGDTPPPLRRGFFFSMAASAIRRDVWERIPFDEALRYSEDVDWTHRIAAAGHVVSYIPDSRFEHSHDYTLAQHLKRRRGEGEAEGRMYGLGSPAVFADLLRPLAGSMLRDLRSGELSIESVAVRSVQATGHYLGRRAAVAPRS